MRYDYKVYIYDDENGDKLVDHLVFDNEETAIDFADKVVDKYERVEVIKCDNKTNECEKVY